MATNWPDAVVIGSGPNGLVAANVLADAGWDVLVLEAQPEPGGAVRTAEVTAPGFRNDLFSAFYPLGVASPALTRLELDRHGLRWRHAPRVLAHPLPDGRAAVISRDLAETVDSVSAFDPADGAAWEALVRDWRALSPHLVDLLLRPFPPVRSGLQLLRRLGLTGAPAFARLALLPVSRLSRELFRGEGAPLLLTGNAMHTDLSPDDAGSGLFGWLLAMLAQEVGFPVPVGGAGALTDALVARLRSAGGALECGAQVVEVVVRGGRATGVLLADGRSVPVRRAVLADVTAPQLYLDLLGGHLPDKLRRDLDRFTWDDATVKVDWALAAPIPWRAEAVRSAGTVHVGGDMPSLRRFSSELKAGQLPGNPFLLLGQMTTADPSRSPAGTESAWAYTHVPRAPRGDAAGLLGGDLREASCLQAFVTRMEDQVEALAPGFKDLVLARHVQSPQSLEAQDANLVGGALNGGSSSLHQQLVLRPTPGLGRPETFVEGLYLASASAHPGGGVHGACGANAAHAALRAGTTGRLVLPVTRALAGCRPGALARSARGDGASRRS